MKKCSTKNCGGDVYALGKCVNCYQYIRRAMSNGLAWVNRRQEKLDMYNNRLEEISNVRPIAKKRTA